MTVIEKYYGANLIFDIDFNNILVSLAFYLRLYSCFRHRCLNNKCAHEIAIMEIVKQAYTRQIQHQHKPLPCCYLVRRCHIDLRAKITRHTVPGHAESAV